MEKFLNAKTIKTTKGEVARRLGKIAHLYNLGFVFLCSRYSIPFSSIYTYSAENMPASTRQKIIRLCKDFWINPDWLLYGRGVPLLDIPCDFLPIVNVDLNNMETLKVYIQKSGRNRFWATLEEFDAWIFRLLEKIHQRLNACKNEILIFREIVRTYFRSGLRGLSLEQKWKICKHVPDPEVAALLHLCPKLNFREFWERFFVEDQLYWQVYFYRELADVMLFDAKVPNHKLLANRPVLCSQCQKIVCPFELRESGGKCPWCKEKILTFVWGGPIKS